MSLFVLKGVNYENIVSYSDIEISEGGATFICGDSGSGKSTLLKLLNGILTPSAGMITYLGEDIGRYDSIVLRRAVLLVSQAAYLFDDRSIRDNFKAYYDYREMTCIGDEEMAQFLAVCSFDLSLDTMSYNLSGGEKQRVFIAICLSFGSKVLMLDEPTSALDARNANALMENIKLFCAQKGQTLLVVSHDKKIVDKFADKTVHLGGDGE